MTRALFVVIVCAASPLAAQQSIPRMIDSGVVVRMHAAGAPLMRGRLLHAIGPGTTSIRFCRYPAPSCTAASVPEAFGEVNVTALDHLDVQAGNKWALGAVIGGLIGAALGTIAAGFASYCDHSACSRDQFVPFITPTLLLGGIGAMMASGSHRWKIVF